MKLELFFLCLSFICICLVATMLTVFLAAWSTNLLDRDVHSASQNSEHFEEPPARVEVRVVRQKCNEYAELACNNPIPSNKMPVNLEGTNTFQGAFPHMAFLHLWAAGTDGFVQLCGGSLISEHFIMTAAHCVYGFKSKDIVFKLGEVDWNMNIASEWWSPVHKIIIHEKYVHNANIPRQYDIALLKLAEEVEFDWTKRPICLNTDLQLIDKTNATVSGWGTDAFGESSTHLQAVDQYLDGLKESECLMKRRYHDVHEMDMICAAHPQKSQSLCPGDSGGTLQIPLKKINACTNTYEQIGIFHSIATNCTEESPKPRSVAWYIRVDKFIDWIVPKVWPALLKIEINKTSSLYIYACSIISSINRTNVEL